MGIISTLTPLNLAEEHDKFFADFNYNPQFTYSQHFEPSSLTQWGLPQEKYFHSVEKLLSKHGFWEMPAATLNSEIEVANRITTLLNKLQLDWPLKIAFSDRLISRCSINSNQITFRVPVEFGEEDFKGLLNHEIQTHLLRRVNHAHQGWSKNADDDSLQTEEGMANMHTFIEQSDKKMRRSWMNYCAIYLAQKYSFAEVFKKMCLYGVDEDRAWFATVRTKRGLTDTSLPGGNTKGLAYLHGSVRVWNWIMDRENNARDLYLGRINLEDIESYKQKADLSKRICPSFMEDMEQYLLNIEEIGLQNKLDTF